MRIVKLPPFFTDPNAHFRLAVYIASLITVAHFAAFPLIASFDGMDYVRLARVLTSGNFPADWNFTRTPLFPLLMRGAFRLGGEQPNAALFITTLFGWGGTILIGSTAARIAGGTTGAATLILLAFYPVLVGYQHMLLSETGIFFFLALLVWSMIVACQSRKRESLIWPFLIGLVIGVGYYWRPTILYLTPTVVVAYLVATWTPRQTRQRYSGLVQQLRRQPMRILPGVLILAITPWLVGYPWSHLTAKYAPQLGFQYPFGMGVFRQALIPVDDPSLGPLSQPYRLLVDREAAGGRMPVAGLSTYDNRDLMEKIASLAQRIGAGQLIRQHPAAYVSGVARAMTFFLGVPGYEGDDENGNFSRSVFTLSQSGTNLDAVLGWDHALRDFTPPAHEQNGTFGAVFALLLPYYARLVLMASVFSLCWLFAAVIRAEPVGLVLTGIPIAFLFLHAVTLFNMDRYAFPVYPILLADLIIGISLVYRTFLVRRSGEVAVPGNTIMTIEDPQNIVATGSPSAPPQNDAECVLLKPADDVTDPEISVVIPALNEPLTIADTVDWCKEGFAKAGIVGEVLIVDSSTDKTPEIALAHGARVLRVAKRGLGRAYIDAIPYIRANYILMGDADCTYDFRELQGFVEKFRAGFEFIMGSRFRGSIEDGAMPGLHRYFGTPFTTAILNFLYGSKFSDIHCGMRGITKAALERIDLESQSWEYASEMVLKSVCYRLRTAEVPVRFLKDREGRSSHMKRGGFLEPWRAGWINLRAMLVYHADLFMLKPGLVLLLLGLALTLPETFGPARIGPITLSLYWELVGMTLAVVGLQSFYLGCLLQIIYRYSEEAVEQWVNIFSYTRAIVIALALLVLGLGLAMPLALQYVSGGMALPAEAGPASHMAVVGLLCISSAFLTFGSTLGVQAALLRGNRRPRRGSEMPRPDNPATASQRKC